MAEGFYGGVNGQSFEIKTTFNTKVDQDADIGKAWASPISVGEFVVISYGLPSDADYEVKRTTDLNAYGKSYNSTLWQKIYDEDHDEQSNGLSYQMISSMTGNTPKLTMSNTVIEPNENPSITPDYSDVDNPKIVLNLPHSVDFQEGSISVTELECDDTPKVSLGQAVDSEGVAIQNTKAFKFELPKSQVISAVAMTEALASNESPVVKLITEGTIGEVEATITHPILQFSLPKAQAVKIFTPTDGSNVLDPGKNPYVELNESDPSNPVLTFYLPTTPEMQAPTTNIVSPSTEPSVKDIGTVRKPQLEFSLPKAVKFYYGEWLQEKSKTNYTLIIGDSYPGLDQFEVGDYYIGASTGFIYSVSGIADGQVTFHYEACIQAPLPKIAANSLSSFVKNEKGELVRNEVVASRDYENANEQTGEQITFEFPLIPKFEIDKDKTSFLGAKDLIESAVNLNITDADTMKFDFTLHEGSKIYAGVEAPETIDDARTGDIYIDAENGVIYEYEESEWIKRDGTFKGPTGSSLKIIKQETYSSDDGKDDLDVIAALILKDLGELPASDEIIAVTYQDKDADTEISYWYFYTRLNSTTDEGAWGRVQLTGGVSNLIQNTKVDAGDTNKAYSVTYVNNLEITLKEELGNEITEKRNEVYSKEEVDEKFQNWLIEWGSFSDLITDSSSSEEQES